MKNTVKINKTSKKIKNNLIDVLYLLKKGRGRGWITLILLILLLSVSLILKNDKLIDSIQSIAEVTKVIDGDTVDVLMENGKTERIRLIGVNTPEKGQPYFSECSDFTREKLLNEQVYLEFDVAEKDKYQRFLAYIWLSPPQDTETPLLEEIKLDMFNAQLLLSGYGQVMTVPPNVKYQEYFLIFEREARENKRGLWK